jgi:hypothetical protein
VVLVAAGLPRPSVVLEVRLMLHPMSWWNGMEILVAMLEGIQRAAVCEKDKGRCWC